MSESTPPQTDRRPLILTIGGHDPSAAGIQADIETCAALGCLAVSVVTALTTQNTSVVRKVIPSQPEDVRDQIRTLLEDFNPQACKVGLVPNAAIGEVIARFLSDELKDCPCVIDPLIRAGSGGTLGSHDMARVLVESLIPRAEIVTPNAGEVLELTACDDLETGVSRLLQCGCNAILVTDTVDESAVIVNQLYLGDLPPERFEMKRIPGSFHGSGCTLATAVACHRAMGSSIRNAIAQGQKFAHAAVRNAYRFGSKQAIPGRFPPPAC